MAGRERPTKGGRGKKIDAAAKTKEEKPTKKQNVNDNVETTGQKGPGGMEDIQKRMGSLGGSEFGGRKPGQSGLGGEGQRRIGTLGSLGSFEPPSAPGRLASVNAGPTTLGGVAKRSFAPRIPTVPRVKTEIKASEDTAKTEDFKPKFPEKKERARPQLTENFGLFSMGPIGSQNTSGLGNVYMGDDAGDGAGEFLEGGHKVKDDEDTEDYAERTREGAAMEPIALPMSNYRKTIKKAVKPEGEVKMEMGSELMGENDEEVTVDSKQRDTDEAVGPAQYFTQAAAVGYGPNDLWKSPLMFFQLPPALPVEPIKKEAPVRPGQRAKAQGIGAGESDEFKDQLKELSDGYMGKLRIHKSGKVTLRLGAVTME
eukprot:Ihof_evm2s297 gene=Ihof_evmTU2s297